MNSIYDMIGGYYAESVMKFRAECDEIRKIYQAEKGVCVFGKSIRRRVRDSISQYIHNLENYEPEDFPLLFDTEEYEEMLIEDEFYCVSDAYPLEKDVFRREFKFAVLAITMMTSRAFRRWVRFAKVEGEIENLTVCVLRDTLELVEEHERKMSESGRWKV